MKYDNLLKTIFQDAMSAMVRALGYSPVVEYLSAEFPSRPAMIADIVARLADGRILHLEFQSSNDPRMHWRCYYYFGAIQEQWPDVDIIQVVIYLGNDPLKMIGAIKRPTVDYRYHIVDMRTIPAQTFLDAPTDAERVLAVLGASPDPRETIRRVLGSWKHLSDKVLLENIERLRTLSQLRGIEIIAVEELKRMPFDLDITESFIFRMGEALLLSKQLEHLFGPLSPATRDLITKASKEEIERWSIRALRADSRERFHLGPHCHRFHRMPRLGYTQTDAGLHDPWRFVLRAPSSNSSNPRPNQDKSTCRTLGLQPPLAWRQPRQLARDNGKGRGPRSLVPAHRRQCR